MSQIEERFSLDRLLDPVTRCLTPEAARRLVSLRADPEFQERIDLLADRCTEGELTPEEREAYENYVRTIQIIAVLQSKARKLLDGRPSQVIREVDAQPGSELAENRCEYAGTAPEATPAPLVLFHIEHMVPRKHGGSDDPSNLALACHHCNEHKGPTAGLDPATGEMCPFSPPDRRTGLSIFFNAGA